jgi:hypothetical protein
VDGHYDSRGNLLVRRGHGRSHLAPSQLTRRTGAYVLLFLPAQGGALVASGTEAQSLIAFTLADFPS